ncbi:MAG: type II toxin-antitoxin system HipA family toxin [Acidimicrobiales bacterium]
MSAYVPVDVVEVRAWGQTVGAVARDPAQSAYAFEYAPEWLAGGIELAPIHLPNGPGVFSFSDLDPGTWKRLPPLLSDSLPDDFGNALVDAWMARQGIDRDEISALDRLAYTADRGMGALTFHPPAGPAVAEPTALALADLVASARQALTGDLAASAPPEHNDTSPAEEALRQLILVGSSAGGARAKALVAFNPETGQIRSGQFDAPDGFSQWLVKLDGASAGVDRGAPLSEGEGFGRIEYAYHLMALEAGVGMAECRLLPEAGRAHFITRRFDRGEGDERLHMLTLCAMDHASYRRPGAYAYEQLLLVADRLGLGSSAATEIFRRCVFNVVAVNRDDHTKNTAFLCAPDGAWTLAPAYDLTHSYRIDSEWVARHQMSVNGKIDGITRADLEAIGDRFAIKAYRAIIDEVCDAVSRWPSFAAEAGVADAHVAGIQADMERFALR